MKAAVKYSIAGALAAAFFVGMISLYGNVREEQRRIVCGRLDVSFADSLRFVSEQDIREYLDAHYGPCIGERLDSVQLARIEDMLEIRSSVFAERADKVFGQFITFINISANFADITLLSFCLRLRLNVILIVCICHCFNVSNHT